MKSRIQAAMSRITGSLIAAATVSLAAGAHAGPVALQIGSNMIVGPSGVDFGNFPFVSSFAAPPNGFGVFGVEGSVGGDFAAHGVATFDVGSIRSLGSPFEIPGTQITPAILFMTFQGAGSNLQLFATNIPVGNDGMFTVTAIPGNSTESLSFIVEGYVLDLSTNTKIDNFSALFGTQFDGTLAQVEANSTPLSVSASIVTTPISPAASAPEPTTWALMISGFGLAGGALRSRRVRRA